MIDFRFKKIFFFQAFFISLLGLGIYFYFKSYFSLKIPTHFAQSFFIIWLIFTLINLLFIRLFALPSKKLLNKIETQAQHSDFDWEEIEVSLDKKEFEINNIKNKFQKENLTYKSLLDSLDDPVFIFDINERILYSNNAFNLFFQVDENLTNISFLEITRNLEFQEFVKRAINKKEIITLTDFTFQHLQDPLCIYYDIKISPIEKYSHFLCVFHNTTERKSTDQMREDFVANFSHEVRTPLTIVNGQLQTIKSDLISNQLLNENLRNSFEKIEHNSKRLLNLFNDLLVLTSIEKKKKMSSEEIPFEMMIESIFDEISQNYPQKNMTLTIPSPLPPYFGNYQLFEQVFLNLIDNSFKYSCSENPSLEVVAKIEDDHYLLELKDNGIGIADDHLHRIFERFYRTDYSRSTQISGTGLGLSIVKHIILNHGGRIKALSELNKGTTFQIILPIS
jgi:two-component system phosphate regulon sensor histidine kinase PhoR